MNIKALFTPLLAFALVSAFFVPAFAQTTQKSGHKEVKKNFRVTGEVVDLWCFIDHEGHGQKHRNCAIQCATDGNPIGIVTKTGDIYIMMGGKKHQAGHEVLINRMAETITVTGTLMKTGGVQAVYVNKVSPPAKQRGGPTSRPGRSR